MSIKSGSRVYRAKRDLTQEELAVEPSVSGQTVTALETDTHSPGVACAPKLTDRVDFSVEEFLY
jgi:putative transcriptional regulator